MQVCQGTDASLYVPAKTEQHSGRHLSDPCLSGAVHSFGQGTNARAGLLQPHAATRVPWECAQSGWGNHLRKWAGNNFLHMLFPNTEICFTPLRSCPVLESNSGILREFCTRQLDASHAHEAHVVQRKRIMGRGSIESRTDLKATFRGVKHV
jgi:hypothetical protein